MNKLIPLIILVLVLASCKEKEPTASKKALDPIEYSMDNNANLILENSEINSISIGVFKDGKTYQKYYGEMDKGEGNKPDENTIFEIASVTKTFTGFITAQAVLEGKLDLEDDIRKYLDDPYDHLEYNGRPIKIRDLLTHSSGITRDLSKTLTNMFSLTASAAEKQAVAEYSREDLKADLINFRLDTIPGKRYDYSPVVGPEILAIILEKVFEKPYEELLNEFVLKEAQLNDTAMQLKAGAEKHLINGYTDDGILVAPIPIPMTGAGAGLKSTTQDQLRYIQFLLESENPVIQEMKKPLFVDDEGDEYGYFWQLGDDGTFMHNGGTNGSTNWLIVMPKFNSGFTVMFNSNGNDVSGDLINDIAGSILEDLENYPVKNAYFSVRKAILDNTDSGIQYYHQLKKDSLLDFDFEDSSMLNAIGYELLRNDKIMDAIKVFQLLVAEFPDSSNPYDSLGEGYLMNEQFDLALTNYKKSLELNPQNGNAEKMIEQIKQIQEQ